MRSAFAFVSTSHYFQSPHSFRSAISGGDGCKKLSEMSTGDRVGMTQSCIQMVSLRSFGSGKSAVLVVVHGL